MELLNINKFEKHSVESHTCLWSYSRLCWHVILVLMTFKVFSISCNISNHDMVFIFVNFPKTYSFTNSIAFKKYQRVADASHFHGIEQTLNEIDASTVSAWQLGQTHNDYLVHFPLNFALK